MTHELIFIAEHDGEIEIEFKNALSRMFLDMNIPLRAYLAVAEWQADNALQPILCLKIPEAENLHLLNQCAAVFKSMFAEQQHLDIIFITSEQEQNLRTFCCPFFTSKRYSVSQPDFYLFSHEGYQMDDQPRACFMRQRIYNNRHDGLMLCDISPPLLGQPFGLGDKNIQQLLFGNKHEGDSLFPVSQWPLPIYVFRLLNGEIIDGKIAIDDCELIAWASIYKCKEDIK